MTHAALLDPRTPLPTPPALAGEACRLCPVHQLEGCPGLAGAAHPPGGGMHPAERVVAARRIVCRAGDTYPGVPFICEGWAAASHTLANGRRQILEFLLPGDVFSALLLFGPKARWLVEAITEVRYRAFDRAELTTAAVARHDRAGFSEICVTEMLRAQELAIDLGRRTAEERVAQRIVSLRDRLDARGMVDGRTMPFPLRQHHLADATGLTSVHVNKVLARLRRDGLVEVRDRSMTLPDLPALRRLAQAR
jgi:CRP/FNR family transcriptional regulator